MPRYFTVHLEVEVYDEKQLQLAAEQQAIKDGLTPEEWAETRKDDPVGCDLIMCLDPGLGPDGTSITQSTVDELGDVRAA